MIKLYEHLLVDRAWRLFERLYPGTNIDALFNFCNSILRAFWSQNRRLFCYFNEGFLGILVAFFLQKRNIVYRPQREVQKESSGAKGFIDFSVADIGVIELKYTNRNFLLLNGQSMNWANAEEFRHCRLEQLTYAHTYSDRELRGKTVTEGLKAACEQVSKYPTANGEVQNRYVIMGLWIRLGKEKAKRPETSGASMTVYPDGATLREIRSDESRRNATSSSSSADREIVNKKSSTNSYQATSSSVPPQHVLKTASAKRETQPTEGTRKKKREDFAQDDHLDSATNNSRNSSTLVPGDRGKRARTSSPEACQAENCNAEPAFDKEPCVDP
eukprot:GILJ01015230.1.p1 GENE.GILJ01015230.1~~GILJ01015230.1.p1  ORF type:complete len:330 (-),score=15.17 GILJ01015230.1:175-1164(-)